MRIGRQMEEGTDHVSAHKDTLANLGDPRFTYLRPAPLLCLAVLGGGTYTVGG